MELVLLGVLVGFPLLALAGMAAYVYHDAPRYDMNPRKWAAISFFVPFFGFFAYLFERDERKPETGARDEHFVDGPFEIHRSRADDAPFATSADGETDDEGVKTDESDGRADE